MVELPAELADEIDPQACEVVRPTEICWPESQGKFWFDKIGIGKLLEDFAAVGAGQHEHAPLACHRMELHAAIGGQRLAQIVVVMALEGARRNQVVAVLARLVDGEFGAYAATRRQHVAKRDAADLLRDAVGENAVEPRFGALDP